MANKYVSPSRLQLFLENLKNLFAAKTTVDELSSAVAYINEDDNENVTEIEGEIISNEELNSLLAKLEVSEA